MAFRHCRSIGRMRRSSSKKFSRTVACTVARSSLEGSGGASTTKRRPSGVMSRFQRELFVDRKSGAGDRGGNQRRQEVASARGMYLQVGRRMNAAYALEDYAVAKQALETLHRELMDLNPSAARSLGEAMEETLTVHRLHLPVQLRKTIASTNVIESAFSIVEQVCKNVKRWHGGDQRERWVGSGLLVAEKQFRRITGYKLIPVLMRELEALTAAKVVVVKRKKAS